MKKLGEKTLIPCLPIILDGVIWTTGLKKKSLSVRTPWNLSNQWDQSALEKTLFDKKNRNSDMQMEPELRWEKNPLIPAFLEFRLP